MILKLLLLFTLVPLAELFLLLQLSTVVGLGLTIGIVVVTGVIGVMLAKSQGLVILARLQEQVDRGEVPGGVILDGLFVLVGGVFLITPGLITDLCGFICLIPWARGPIKRYLRRKLEDMIARGDTHIYLRRW